jgi:hypothetical protein
MTTKKIPTPFELLRLRLDAFTCGDEHRVHALAKAICDDPLYALEGAEEAVAAAARLQVARDVRRRMAKMDDCVQAVEALRAEAIERALRGARGGVTYASVTATLANRCLTEAWAALADWRLV